MTPEPWHAGLATGIGSLPGVDPMEAAALIAGELPDLPHLVELPDRGPGAEMIGRTLAVCLEIPAEIAPTGWRLAQRPGRDIRRAQDFLAWDLDAAEQHYRGAPWVKLQVTGPWTLAANVETPKGHRALTDVGAVRDLAESLAEGLAEHIAQLTKRLPGAGFVVQFDEPSLLAVLSGTLSTASGFGEVPAVAAADVQELLARVRQPFADRPTVVHCCHADAPVRLLRGAGFDAISLDLTVRATDAAHLDPIGEAMEAGIVLLAGLVRQARNVDNDPMTTRMDTRTDPDFKVAAEPLLDMWDRLGLPDRALDQVAVTPVCGLAGGSSDSARDVLRRLRDTGKYVADCAQGR